MRVPRCGLCLGVAKDPPHHREAFASHHRLRGECVPEVMNAHILEPGRLADPPPRLLEVRQVRALRGSGDDMGVALNMLRPGQNLQRRPVEGDRLGTRLRIRQVDTVPPDVFPLERLDLRQARPRVQQQPKRRHRRWCERLFLIQCLAQTRQLVRRQEPLAFLLLVLADMIARI